MTIDDPQSVIIHFECNCGYKRFGTVRDDPSCVMETANGLLLTRIKEHINNGRTWCWTYDAYLDPLNK